MVRDGASAGAAALVDSAAAEDDVLASDGGSVSEESGGTGGGGNDTEAAAGTNGVALGGAPAAAAAVGLCSRGGSMVMVAQDSLSWMGAVTGKLWHCPFVVLSLPINVPFLLSSVTLISQ